MPLVQTRGAASAQGFGEFAQSGPANYIEEVFSTYLYTGNGSTQTITNNIDLSTKGGMVWIKNRTGATDHRLTDTVRGATKSLKSNSLSAEATESTGLTAFSTTGFSIGANVDYNNNASPTQYTSWTFREQPKFFDIVTWTGDGTAGRQIPHSLGSAPGCIIIKSRSLGYVGWYTWHRSLGDSGAYGKNLVLDTTAAAGAAQVFGASAQQTSTYWTTGSTANLAIVNATSETYVAYLFAHDAGGFGLTGTDNVISCGSYTGTGAAGNAITLGYEPQWLLIKRSSSAGNDWTVIDNMRGMSMTTSQWLYPNTSSAETDAGNQLNPTATGFTVINTGGALNSSGSTYIYIAIRRGPMKVPTVGTNVFYPNAIPNGNTLDSSNVPFPPDLVNTFSRNGTNRASVYNQFSFLDRLRGLGVPNNTFVAPGPSLTSSSTGAESSSPGAYVQLKADGQNISRDTGWLSALYGDFIYYFMRRAPSFFDVVCYTGTGSATTFTHNLGVVPELMIVKCRSSASPGSRAANWEVYSATAGAANFGVLNSNINWETYSPMWNSTAPTSSVFTVGSWGAVNASGETFVAYLFASCPGVSKVGSYTGTGTLQTINCGFTSGARFVLIRRYGTSSGTGDWYVWDSVRGITSGNDPYLLLNDTAAEVTGTNYVDTDSTGFKVTAAAPAEINNSGSTFIFLAIA